MATRNSNKRSLPKYLDRDANAQRDTIDGMIQEFYPSRGTAGNPNDSMNQSRVVLQARRSLLVETVIRECDPSRAELIGPDMRELLPTA